MAASVKFIQLNIEGSKHLDRVIPFLKEQEPDVVCLQELKEHDVAKLEKELSMKCFFYPMHSGKTGINGNGILTRLSSANQSVQQYGGIFTDSIPAYVHDEEDRERSYNSSRFILLAADIEKEGTHFRILTTHFPVSVSGKPSDFQRKDLARLLELLGKEKEFVIAGDFNAPRGGEIFSGLAEKYKDNIPTEIRTSLDYGIHRAGREKLEASAHAMGMKGLMVDGIFSTPSYTVSNVRVYSGVSDHCAFSAEISKA